MYIAPVNACTVHVHLHVYFLVDSIEEGEREREGGRERREKEEGHRENKPNKVKKPTKRLHVVPDQHTYMHVHVHVHI